MLDKNTIIKIENLTAGYAKHIVLKNVCLSLEKGEILVIIGQNGSGKSTLLKTICGLLTPKLGNIRINDKKMKTFTPNQLIKYGISYFAQGGLVMPSLTVEEHLKLAIMQTNRKLQKTDFDIIFTELPQLNELKKQKAGNLSGGERQILSLGILLMQHTQTWLLDEPTAGLSPSMVQFTFDFLQKKNKDDGITILLVEHNMEVAFQLASNIAVTKEGVLTRKYCQAEFLEKDFLNKIVYN